MANTLTAEDIKIDVDKDRMIARLRAGHACPKHDAELIKILGISEDEAQKANDIYMESVPREQ